MAVAIKTAVRQGSNMDKIENKTRTFGKSPRAKRKSVSVHKMQYEKVRLAIQASQIESLIEENEQIKYKLEVIKELFLQGGTLQDVGTISDAMIKNGIANKWEPKDTAWAIMH